MLQSLYGFIMLEFKKEATKILSSQTSHLDVKAIEKSLKFVKLLFDWHDKKNLISTRDPLYFLKRDFYDTIQFSNYLNNGQHIDVGTGAGIPGLILSILRPNDQFVLVDRREYSIRFLQHAQLALKLDNISIMQVDVNKLSLSSTPTSIILKNFSNKKISNLPVRKKMSYLYKLIKTRVSGDYVILVLTGSLALEMPKTLSLPNVGEVSVRVKKLTSPFFDECKYILEMI